MVKSVSARATHYEILGLKRTATSDEIARAFAREMSAFRPHSISGLADVTVAHETLRDPAKRRAYDASLGLGPEPRPTQLLAWSGVGGASFVGRSSFVGRTQPVEQPVLAEPTPPELPANPESRAEATPFIAAALRELARPEPLHDPARASRPQPEPPRPPQATPALDPPGGANRDLRPALDEQLGEAEEGPIPWKRTAIAAGGLVLGVVLLGAWAGWSAGDGGERKSAVKLALPPSTTFTVADPAAPAPASVVKEAQPVQPRRPALGAARVERRRAAPRLAELERQISELPQSTPNPPQAAATEPAAEAALATAVVASMPLPNRVIARTIQRIGYPCGQVASTVPGGAQGVFTVTCTSGHSYQAAPVRGRYRFRRVGGR